MNRALSGILPACILFMLYASHSMAQQPASFTQANLSTIIPVSPNAASLGKFGAVPVSLYTGIPNISIPFYEVTNGPLKVPVSLNYHAGGIRVEEIASSVGLGWSLNAGGIITRTVRGLPDEVHGYMADNPTNRANSMASILSSPSADATKYEQLIQQVSNRERDGEPDIYHYNFGRYSGKFFFDEFGYPYTMPRQNIEIEPYGIGWKITVEDGSVYLFDKEETNTVISGGTDQPVFPSAWYLSGIKSSDGKRDVLFEYDMVQYGFEMLGSETKYALIDFKNIHQDGAQMSCTPPADDNYGVRNYIRGPRLTKIVFPGGYVEFKYLQDRCDLIGDKSLDRIEVHAQDKLVKAYGLAYKYFGPNGDDCRVETAHLKRLALTEVIEENDTLRKNPYKFDYNEEVTLPSRLSRDQDHWGFYNGAGNITLVPTFSYYMFGTQGPYVLQGANRSVDPVKSQAAILMKITYPTTGTTEFFYESNIANSNGYINMDLPPEYEEVPYYFSGNSYDTALPQPHTMQFPVNGPNGGSTVRITASGADCLTEEYQQECDMQPCSIKVYKIDGTTRQHLFNVTNYQNNTTLYLENGTYEVAAEVTCQEYKPRYFEIFFYVNNLKENPGTSLKRYSGGLRISKLIDTPGYGGEPIMKTYSYHEEDNLNESSGYVVGAPFYEYNFGQIKYGEAGDSCDEKKSCEFIAKSSSTTYPLATTQGGYTGYSFVRVDQNGNGYTTYKYLSPADYPDSPAKPTFPFAITNYDWRRGILIEQKEYRNEPGGSPSSIVKAIFNEYRFENPTEIIGLKVGRLRYRVGDCWAAKIWQTSDYLSAKFSTVSEFPYLRSARERFYDQSDPDKYVETVQEYGYSPDHLQLTSITAKNSLEEEVVTYLKYPMDYAFTSTPVGEDAIGIRLLQTKHIVNEVIEQYQVKQKRDTGNNPTEERVIGGTVNSYKPDKPYKDKVLTLDISSPLALTAFGNGSSVNSNAFTKHEAYVPKLGYDSYDEYGNIVQQAKEDGVPLSYLWSYNHQYPVAEIKNATKAEVDAVVAAHSVSFVDAQGNPLADEQMRAQLHILRENLPGAMVSTYTYDPLVGMTSATDSNGRTTFYKYDVLGRLEAVKDEEGNVLQSYEYHYTGQ